MANPTATSDTKQLALSTVNANQNKFIPKKPDGTPFDCTPFATTPSMSVYPSQQALTANTAAQAIVPTIVSHDNTGMVTSITGAQAIALTNVFGPGTFPYVFFVQNAGGDILEVATGTITVNLFS